MASKRGRAKKDSTLLNIPNTKKRALEQGHSYTALNNKAVALRIHSIQATSAAGSGHPSSCSSLAELFAVLFFDPSGLKYFSKDPSNFNNDKLILSKGHAAPILYAAWAEAGFIPTSDLLQLRQLSSALEGHPTPRMPFVDVATGSLGQGISAACGMAYAMKYFSGCSSRVYAVLGDGECAEGCVWEAFNFAAYYLLDNLVAILDVNRLGQSEPTMLQHDLKVYKERLEAFGWNVLCIDGHSIAHIVYALDTARSTKERPTAIVAKTFKGKDFTASIEDQLNWHGKPLGDKTAEVLEHLNSLTEETTETTAALEPTEALKPPEYTQITFLEPSYTLNAQVSTRQAYGDALKAAGSASDRVIGLDGDTKNSTMALSFKQAFPDRFVECFIAEQNMVGTALGLSCRGLVPFVSAFAAFFSRAFDHIRMCGISWGNVKFVGSHCGVSIGEDGGSQMGLEDLAMFRTIPGGIVFYPSDAVSTYRAVQLAGNFKGPCYIRTSRPGLPVIYANNEVFEIGKSKLVKDSEEGQLVIVGAGVTLNEALKAWEVLKNEGIAVKVVDVFSVKPLDTENLLIWARQSGLILTVEDHYREGGVFEAVAGGLASEPVRVEGLWVTGVPRSGKPDELLDLFGISSNRIVEKVKTLLNK